MLNEMGLLQLDDPVSNYLPMFKDMRVLKSGQFPDFQTVCHFAGQ